MSAVAPYSQCLNASWPVPDAAPSACFGLRTKGRTYHFFCDTARDAVRWMEEIQRFIPGAAPEAAQQDKVQVLEHIRKAAAQSDRAGYAEYVDPVFTFAFYLFLNDIWFSPISK